MAKEMVTLAFIFAIVFSAFSPTIAEIVEKHNFKPVSEGEIVLATNEDEQAPARRYGPWIRQPIFSFSDEGYCSQENPAISCDDCDQYCKRGYRPYGRCVGVYGFRTCTCYFKCSPW
ncbi:hypothetical protein ISN45_Aa03g034960 [Arabidopsis thaliana x Arabidopsis arenosa]|uniref:Uncharacterized protein n=1 Tax=Arabidopsis thaliana x Arabidopsis arenosa TaxID=1240361 RepID=A0A8T2B2U9_9BRAS|nr:hypothetical protein ISN45_Aa03g034960 [Arabidopsis thaliana x Arabidopsis arenosa]